MLRTIVIGSCVSVQGIFVRDMGNGKIAVKVGDRVYVGKPVEAAKAA